MAVTRDRLVRGMQWWSASRGHEIEGRGVARNDRLSRDWQWAERPRLRPAARYRTLSVAPYAIA